MGTCFLYGNGGGSGSGSGIGALLTVTAPAGATVTVSKDDKTKTKIAGDDGLVEFKGLETGEWTITITNGTQTASKIVTITADYATSITFFEATINITYPKGSTCTATCGSITLTAPDTSGTWACIVSNPGTWTIKSTKGSQSNSATVSVTTSGATYSAKIVYRLYLYNTGDTCTSVTGGYRTTNQATFNNTGTYLAVYSETGKAGSAATKNTIDLTDYSKLIFNGYANKDVYNNLLYVGNAYASGFNYITNSVANIFIPQGSTAAILELDISSITGAYHAGFGASNGSNVYAKELYLET